MMGRVNRPFPKVVHRIDVCNQSPRNGGSIQLIVLHDTEGANIKGVRDLQGLGSWFDNPAAQASSHVATDEDGCSARFVPDAEKAWAQSFYNSAALSIEQIGFASQNWQAASKDKQLREAARWIARWNRVHGVPIRRAVVAPNGRIVRSGVIQHRRLGYLGGSHHDVHPRFPMRKVLRYAKEYARIQTKIRQEA
jgi:hypothetical protein